jgi:uncharacterized SAM-binding protein YcdF (DUF218 family)
MMQHFFSFGFLALPTVFITLSLVGALIALSWRRVGAAVVLASSLCLFAASTPALSSLLLREAEAELPRDVRFPGAQAIVVLAAGVRLGDGTEIQDRLGPRAFERLALAAEAHRRLRLPVAVSGGPVHGSHVTEGALMRAALKEQFAISVAWIEERSRNTWENAAYTAELLRPAKVETVVVVSHAWHLPRALWAFERARLKALPWPAPRTPQRLSRVEDYLPSLEALQDSFHALHEMAGMLYYKLHH